MKEIAIGLLAFGAVMMTMGFVVAMGAYAYGHSNVLIQWIHHPIATGVFGVGLVSAYLGMLGWMDLKINGNW